MDDGLPVLFIDEYSILATPEMCNLTGLQMVDTELKSLKIIAQSDLIGFEVDGPGRIDEFP